DTMSIERRAILTRRGADIRLSAGAEGMAGAIQLANRLATDPRRVFMPRQFDNPANPAIHLRTTGPEIDAAMNGRIDWFVAGVGTGGTITGAGTYLRTRHPQIQVIAVEPAESPVLSGGRPGVHGIQGLGAGFIPSVLAVELIDEIVTVTTEQALCMARRLAREEGIFTGPSGGAAVHAAWMAAQRADVDGHRIVTVAPDSGERYLSLTETDGGTEA
ncbi:pyridoxal-phosphate dependent enzyme, partial [bacterium]|nr:pyridoxal-phosphate dependent enzyme [candidate division CSSED10-310 bacterium]